MPISCLEDVLEEFEPQQDDRYALCVFQKLVLTMTNGFDKMYRIILDQ